MSRRGPDGLVGEGLVRAGGRPAQGATGVFITPTCFGLRVQERKNTVKSFIEVLV